MEHMIFLAREEDLTDEVFQRIKDAAKEHFHEILELVGEKYSVRMQLRRISYNNGTAKGWKDQYADRIDEVDGVLQKILEEIREIKTRALYDYVKLAVTFRLYKYQSECPIQVAQGFCELDESEFDWREVFNELFPGYDKGEEGDEPEGFFQAFSEDEEKDESKGLFQGFSEDEKKDERNGLFEGFSEDEEKKEEDTSSEESEL